MEQDYGFSEAADHTNGKKKNFFNLGNRNNYKNFLRKRQLSIEELFVRNEGDWLFIINI